MSTFKPAKPSQSLAALPAVAAPPGLEMRVAGCLLRPSGHVPSATTGALPDRGIALGFVGAVVVVLGFVFGAGTGVQAKRWRCQRVGDSSGLADRDADAFAQAAQSAVDGGGLGGVVGVEHAAHLALGHPEVAGQTALRQAGSAERLV